MKALKVPHLIAIAALCWVVLICIQAKWIGDSRNLIEEQFDQKVSLALCAAVSSLDSSTVKACSAPTAGIGPICTPIGVSEVVIKEDGEVDTALFAAVDEALAFYDIHLTYNLTLASETSPDCDPASPYCCAINPFTTSENTLVSIAFPGKNAFLLKKIWWMLATSIFILLFILAVFVLALRALILQKRISEWNVDFFNNMAHEFRTPLTNIRLAMQRLVRKNPHLARDPYIDIVRKEDHRLSRQIEQVLNMAAMENGQPYLNRRKLDIRNVVREVVDDMQLQIQAANAIVNVHTNGEILFVKGDRFHLSRAFHNMIDNALKYSDTTPIIDIHVQKQGENISVVFEDNGIGVQRQNGELIFNKFHRVPNGNRHDNKGFGLGLSYVRTIMNDHQGSIRMLDKMKKGSQFELTLPGL